MLLMSDDCASVPINFRSDVCDVICSLDSRANLEIDEPREPTVVAVRQSYQKSRKPISPHKPKPSRARKKKTTALPAG